MYLIEYRKEGIKNRIVLHRINITHNITITNNTTIKKGVKSMCTNRSEGISEGTIHTRNTKIEKYKTKHKQVQIRK